MPRITPAGNPLAELPTNNRAVQWVDHPQRPSTASSTAIFRLRFTVEEAQAVTLHASADQRYVLYLDGEFLGRGPERGDTSFWNYESYQVQLSAGEHVLAAMSWWVEPTLAAYAQTSARSGFLLTADGEWQARLSTGSAPWEASLAGGIEFLSPGIAWGTGAKVRIDGAAFPWGWQSGEANDWQPAVKIAPARVKINPRGGEPQTPWLLTPSTLPPMREEHRQLGTLRFLSDHLGEEAIDPARHLAGEAGDWQTWLTGHGTVSISPHTTRRAIIDLENYYCAYPVLVTDGGKDATVRVLWAEALFENIEECRKGNRNEIVGKYFTGIGDEFLPDGGDARAFTTLWWEAGRYLEITVATADEPLTLREFTLTETGYPLRAESDFTASDPRLAEVIPIGIRALQMCAHETYMDCPYYEQLMYIGDTRLEVLTTYTLTHDDRLPRKALTAFDHSRLLTGYTQARYPARIAQVIAPFSLWWVCMVHDYWRWRDDAEFVRGMMPGVRGVSEYFRTLITADGLLGVPNGWNFVDWVERWDFGVPPHAKTEPNSIVNLQLILALQYKAELEEFFGEFQLAERDRTTAARMMTAVLEHCWNDERGLLSDDPAKQFYSEHAQCLAILSGLLPADKRTRLADGLLTAPDLERATIYFTHYLFEALYALGRGDQILPRLDLWFGLKAQGLMATFESPEPCRSDCHAWGAHPLYHYHASLLGIRPAAPGFRAVRIAPQLGTLTRAESTLPHPAGQIITRVKRAGVGVQAEVTLPADVSGTFVWEGQTVALKAGENQVEIAGAD